MLFAFVNTGVAYFKLRRFEDYSKNEEMQNENQLSTAGMKIPDLMQDITSAWHL